MRSELLERDGMSDVTERPWQVSTAVCGFHSTEVTCIYHYPNEYTTVEVVEPGCRCGEQAMTEANARHIVHCVNNYDRLVEMVRALAYDYHNATGGGCHNAAHELLAELDTKGEE